MQNAQTIHYTAAELQTSDGRYRRRTPPTPNAISNRVVRERSVDSVASTSTPSVAAGNDPKLLAVGRHTCGECGRHYATSSNLSRHKQTHRPLDSPYARACEYCGRVYVSMPAYKYVTHVNNQYKLLNRLECILIRMLSFTNVKFAQKRFLDRGCSKDICK